MRALYTPGTVLSIFQALMYFNLYNNEPVEVGATIILVSSRRRPRLSEAKHLSEELTGDQQTEDC